MVPLEPKMARAARDVTFDPVHAAARSKCKSVNMSLHVS